MKHLTYELGYNIKTQDYTVDLYAEGVLKPVNSFTGLLGEVLKEVSFYRKAGILLKPDYLHD